MRRLALLFGAGVLSLAASLPLLAQGTAGKGVPPKGPLNTLDDIKLALRGCWKWPPINEIQTGMELTVLLSFKRNGEVFGARITYESANVSPKERAVYHGVLLEALKLCSPLPVTDSLGSAIAGKPMRFRFNDNRLQRKA